MSKIAVAGGTGLLGRLVVEAVRRKGAEPVVIARSRGVDLSTGTGLDAALAGTDAVIDASNIVSLSGKKSIAFFETATDHLLSAEARAGVRHHLVISIVGIDRVDFGYYLGKRRQEDLVMSGSVPWTILRATQFHEFASQALDRPGPIAAVPRMTTQPIAAAEVADALVDLALAGPVGRAPELAGPEVLQLTDMTRRLRHHRGMHKLVVPIRLPGAVGKGMTGGALLPTGPGPRGLETFDAWLERDGR